VYYYYNWYENKIADYAYADMDYGADFDATHAWTARKLKAKIASMHRRRGPEISLRPRTASTKTASILKCQDGTQDQRWQPSSLRCDRAQPATRREFDQEFDPGYQIAYGIMAGDPSAQALIVMSCGYIRYVKRSTYILNPCAALSAR
jgi:hypothetical protein